MHVYSFSQLQCYKRCPLQYKYRYIDKRPEKDEGSERMQLGKAVHSTLEYLHKAKEQKNILTAKEVRDSFLSIWERYQQPDPVHQEQGLAYIEYYYHDVFPQQTHPTIGIENHIMVRTERGHKIRGFVDRVDREHGDLSIHDYKTNSSVTDETHATHLAQLALYAQAYKHHPGAIYGVLHYLHKRETVRILLSESHQHQTMTSLQHTIDEIEDKRMQYQFFGEQDVFTPCTGHHCQRCPFYKVCPAQQG